MPSFNIDGWVFWVCASAALAVAYALVFVWWRRLAQRHDDFGLYASQHVVQMVARVLVSLLPLLVFVALYIGQGRTAPTLPVEVGVTTAPKPAFVIDHRQQQAAVVPEHISVTRARSDAERVDAGLVFSPADDKAMTESIDSFRNRMFGDRLDGGAPTTTEEE